MLFVWHMHISMVCYKNKGRMMMHVIAPQVSMTVALLHAQMDHGHGKSGRKMTWK